MRNKLKKAIIFGNGQYYQKRKHLVSDKYEIVAFLDNDVTKQNKMSDGIRTLELKAALSLEFDYIILAAKAKQEMMNQLLEANVHIDKILDIDDEFRFDHQQRRYPKSSIYDRSLVRTNSIEKHFDKIFVLCPAYSMSGGPELLHQMVYNLNGIGEHAFIVYTPHKQYGIGCNPSYLKYVDGYIEVINAIEDSDSNLIIFPETKIEKQAKWKKAQKAVWWLSVDNYASLHHDCEWKQDLSFFDYHFVQSYYSLDFLLYNSISIDKIYYLSDYLSDEFISILNDISELPPKKTQRFVAYNPVKGITYTTKLIKKMSEELFVPIVNMTKLEVIDLLMKCSVYIDFGNHPGKDRLPREAAALGCCVVTGKRGSAAYNEDVCIPSKYKFDERKSTIDEISGRICYCLDNYGKCIDDFSNYRDCIRIERDEFERDIRRIFTV